MSIVPSSQTPALGDVALAWATAGWPVIPLRPQTKRRRTRSGTEPSSDARQVRDWWSRMPDSNVGVVLDGVPVVVLDVDGPRGEASLGYLAARAGLTGLPQTLTVTTGREDGGSHHWYRLSPGAQKLVNQLGCHHSDTPALDVLFNGLAVAPGSVHKSGVVYSANQVGVPRPEDLAELPEPLYRVLAARGRPKRASVAQTPVVAAPPVAVTAPAGLSGRAWALLQDISDGRDQRTLRAATLLVRLGWEDEEIIGGILQSPLGSKARKQDNPREYLARKIRVARQFTAPAVDKERYWQVLHSDGLPSSQVRIMDLLLRRASPTGYVSMSQGWIGIDSAVASAASPIKELIDRGWLTVVVKGDLDHPSTYCLHLPDTRPDGNLHIQTGPTFPLPPPRLGSYVQIPVAHDAFRSKRGSLHSAYPLLAILRAEPQSLVHLAAVLRVSDRAMRDRLRALMEAGVAILSEEGVSLTDEPLRPLLNAAARRAGTAGARHRAIKEYFARCLQWQQSRAEATVVGSPTWRKIRAGDHRRRLEQGIYDDLRRDWDDDALVEHLVDQQVRSYEHSRAQFKAYVEARIASGRAG